MMAPSMLEIERFRELLGKRLGLHFDETRSDLLAQVLSNRAGAAGQSCAAYLDVLGSKANAVTELPALARELTVTETYFLRYADQFAALVQVALPERIAAAGAEAPLQLLSIGCASGEEPYSMAIAVREHAAMPAARIAITAADINPAMLDKARRARYSPWSLREVPAPVQARWFHSEGSVFRLDDEILQAVRFEARNLAVDDPAFWLPGRFDVIFCRNVLMYFKPEQARAAVARISHALAPGGYLFLGHAETLRGLSNDFHVCHTNDAFYYRREGRHLAPPQPVTETDRSGRWQAPVNLEHSWFETISLAAERIAALSHAGPGEEDAKPPRGAPTPDLAPVREYLARERYDQAQAHLDALAPAHDDDCDVLLLRAVTLSHRGATDAAEATCRALLVEDEMHAGAHYLLALCHESRGDLAAACDEDQIAAYLDPGFAMPRLHLGLIARRQGDSVRASRELERAAVLLQQEDASRLLLYGGGFKRDALIALCRPAPTLAGDR